MIAPFPCLGERAFYQIDAKNYFGQATKISIKLIRCEETDQSDGSTCMDWVRSDRVAEPIFACISSTPSSFATCASGYGPLISRGLGLKRYLIKPLGMCEETFRERYMFYRLKMSRERTLLFHVTLPSRAFVTRMPSQYLEIFLKRHLTSSLELLRDNPGSEFGTSSLQAAQQRWREEISRASQEKNYSAILSLLKKGASISLPSWELESATEEAFEQIEEDDQIVKVLAEHVSFLLDSDLLSPSLQGKVLSAAIKQDRLDLVETLLTHPKTNILFEKLEEAIDPLLARLEWHLVKHILSLETRAPFLTPDSLREIYYGAARFDDTKARDMLEKSALFQEDWRSIADQLQAEAAQSPFWQAVRANYRDRFFDTSKKSSE